MATEFEGSNGTKVQLPNGIFCGGRADGVNYFHAISYAQPFKRFESPVAISNITQSNSIHDATSFGDNCPQMPSRLARVMGSIAEDDFARQSEANCNVLSVYCPQVSSENPLPVIVWMHGGAYITGGSQLPWYDGSRLARDGKVIVVSLNYRLGVFGFLYQEGREFNCAVEDVIVAFEWIQNNIRRFGGDPSNVTSWGQSAGGYLTQILLTRRPDLLRRAIIQSSPNGTVITPKDAKEVRGAVEAHLPTGISLNEASTEDLLKAQSQALRSLPDHLFPFSPTQDSGCAPGMDGQFQTSESKDILIGWTLDDGSCFSAIGCQSIGMPKWMGDCVARQLGASITSGIFKDPSLQLAATLQSQGHRVATFEQVFSPKGFSLGATHCIEVPLLLGHQEAWRSAPMLGDLTWEQWDETGLSLRKQWGRFATDGTVPDASHVLRVTQVRET